MEKANCGSKPPGVYEMLKGFAMKKWIIMDFCVSVLFQGICAKDIDISSVAMYLF
jgi:hypothetical protein